MKFPWCPPDWADLRKKWEQSGSGERVWKVSSTVTLNAGSETSQDNFWNSSGETGWVEISLIDVGKYKTDQFINIIFFERANLPKLDFILEILSFTCLMDSFMYSFNKRRVDSLFDDWRQLLLGITNSVFLATSRLASFYTFYSDSDPNDLSKSVKEPKLFIVFK